MTLIFFILRHIISKYSKDILYQLFKHLLMINYNYIIYVKLSFFSFPTSRPASDLLIQYTDSYNYKYNYLDYELLFLFVYFLCGTTFRLINFSTVLIHHSEIFI